VIKSAAVFPSDLVVMGRIGRPYGVKGWVRIEIYTEYSDSLLEFNEWWISSKAQGIEIPPSLLSDTQAWVPLVFEEGKVYQDGLVVKFKAIDTPEQAKEWGRRIIAISRSHFPELDQEEIYWADLIGLSVFNEQNECLGVVDSLLETGAHDVLCIKGGKGEQLIPYIEPFLKHVDLDAKRIIVDWVWESD
jgi:16S rRNA processing protein RimM